MTEPEWVEIDHRIVEEITRLRARLAAVLALCDLSPLYLATADVRAAAAGDDRAR